MTVLARRVAACPVRTAAEAWLAVVEVLFANGAEGRAACAPAAGVAASTIAEEVPATAPFVLVGAGPRVRVYCAYGEGAVAGDDLNESPVDLDLNGRSWTLWIPCPADDLAWATAALKGAPHVALYDAAEGLPDDAGAQRAEKALGRPVAAMRINEDLFRRL